jgi:hypothetical protein
MNNAKNPYITRIFLLNSNIYNLDFVENEHRHKITQLVVNEQNHKRLRYDCAIQFANDYLFGQKCIVSNSDIYFDDTLHFLTNYNFNKNVFCLSKYENGEMSSHAFQSQDSWFFNSPLQVNMANLNFHFGVPGCDNVFVGVLVRSGHIVSNPGKTIKSHHLHTSNYRTYTEKDRLLGKYYGIHCSELI